MQVTLICNCYCNTLTSKSPNVLQNYVPVLAVLQEIYHALTKNPNSGILWKTLGYKFLVDSTAIWYILWPFGLFFPFWSIEPRQIWQHCSLVPGIKFLIFGTSSTNSLADPFPYERRSLNCCRLQTQLSEEQHLEKHRLSFPPICRKQVNMKARPSSNVNTQIVTSITPA
jgi:hypothetical protein